MTDRLDRGYAPGTGSPSARDAAMNDPENTRPVLTPVDDIPSAFMGDALNADNLDYVLSLYAEYYEKQQVTAAEGE